MGEDGVPDAAADALAALASGRTALTAAAAHYGRPLRPDDYWWLSVCLAAAVLADLNGTAAAGARIQQLADAIGQRGISSELAERLADELSVIGCQGLLWPRFQHGADGVWAPTAHDLVSTFGPGEAYWLALCHVGTAMLHAGGQGDQVAALAALVDELVTGGLAADHEGRVLSALGAIAAPVEDEPQGNDP